MDGPAMPNDDQLDHLDQLDQPPSRNFERLRQLGGYTWDESRTPFHTSYDNWHVFGTRFVSLYSSNTAATSPAPQPHITSSPSALAKLSSRRTNTGDFSGLPLSTPHSEAGSENSATSPLGGLPLASEAPFAEEPIVAKISYHVLREERGFHIAKQLASSTDPEGEHIAKPIEFVRLPPVPGDRGPIVVAIHQFPGDNHIFKLIDLGPAFYWARKVEERWVADRRNTFTLDPPVTLQQFLDFAIGASQCLELIHHGSGIVHGEIRGDAFHFNVDTGKVKLTSFGSGLRSFEHGLTSSGWSTLSKQLGAKNRLLYISPEQTGRMPAEPDSRTDIYSLGVLLWTLLTQRPVFDGASPIDIVQGVLGRRIPNVTAYRMDVPDVIGRIIQKCTSKNVNERYHSASGLRFDLVQVQQLLSTGEHAALQEWQIASRDISSFFILPTKMIGRDKERAELMKVIDKVARSHSLHRRGKGKPFSAASSLSNEIPEAVELSSDGNSSGDAASRRSGSFSHSILSENRPKSFFPSITLSSDSAGGSNSSRASLSNQNAGLPRLTRNIERKQSISFENKSEGSETPRYSSGMDSSSSLSRQLGTSKLRRKGNCEVVVIEGTGGLGKSCLVQSVLADARRIGYCATAKFDTARRQAFGPLLKLLSSLFRQVWGERNTDTPFHQTLKQYVRPAWPMLHQVLGLPEFLLGPADEPLPRAPSSPQSSAQSKRMASLRGTGAISKGPSQESSAGTTNSSAASMFHRSSTSSSHDFLSGGSSTKSIRLMNTFLEVLSLFTHHKFICFCLDDLHFADDESLELISQMIAAKLKMVIIITYRPEEFTPEKVQRVLNPSESGEAPSFGGPTVTKITLSPLNEEDIVHYVSTTLCRPKEDILPLALVIQSKTAGNPFYMREMLSACYRKKCIWYDYKDSHWRYDLKRLFDQFRGEQHYDVLDTAFITRRLKELPPAARSILAWAALLGQTFSFEMICKLMSGEFHYDDDLCAEPNGDHFRKSYSPQDAVEGLHATITAYIIVPSETDDRFRFAHDRYVQAAAALRECNPRMMHFVIAQTLLKYYSTDRKWRDNTASHICEAVDIIKKRVSHRQPFRKLLSECAQVATENGARPTAAKYYSNAVALLQSNPWDDSLEDVSYTETVDLYLRAAECYLFMGRLSAARDVLQTVFTSARTAKDQASAWVLESRVHAQGGDSLQALASLKRCLKALDVKYDESPTFEKCDEAFQRVAVKMQSMDRDDLMSPPGLEDLGLSSLGSVLTETISAAWWSDCLQFYHLSLVMIDLHLGRGAFPQSGMAFLHISMIALARFNMIGFAVETASQALELIDKYRDPYCLARGFVIYANWVGHVHHPISANLNILEGVVDFASSAGDRITAILSFALSAQLKFFASENLTDLETFCLYGCEEIPDWHKDTRGGAILIAVRQTCRALQGKTRAFKAVDVFSDDQHNAVSYKSWLQRTDNGGRSVLLYETMEIVPLFLYGHYEEAIELGQRCYEKSDLIWSARNTRLAMLFYGLALAGTILRQQQDPRPDASDLQAQVDRTVKQVMALNVKIKAWQAYSDVNYLAWSKLLDAQLAEMKGDSGLAIQNYEEALDHALEHNFVFEEALGNYLMANIFIRHKSRRSANSALKDAIGLFRQLGASGIAGRIEAEHSLLLHGPARNMRSNDVGVQTDFAADTPSLQYGNDPGDDGEGPSHDQASGADVKGDRVGAWRGSIQPEAGVAGLPALDMIDLHAILASSRVISSVLRVDDLLKTMCNVILQTCGGSATLAAIVVQDEGSSDWCVAASGDPEGGAEAHIPGIPLSGTPLVAENVILYCTRFREVVFLRDLVSDERFGNVSEQWLQRNPDSKAIIAIPISHGSAPLLGVLYLEGVAGSFTDRNVTVLQHLVNQIAISYSNALAMKAVEKVSAENVSMVALQKRALAKAIEAEAKAKDAEAEAKRNVKLAEEAAKAKSIFLANVSHELRTPLNGVIGNSELLRDSNLNKDQQEMADSIRVSADLLLTVINDILDFSRMEADKMKLYIIAFNPEEMVREVVRAVSYSNREKTSKKNVKIIRDINLPPMLIYGDPIRLHQVLGNLIGNSLKFTEDGSITIGARMDSETEDQATLTFWVKDTGIGISQQQMQKLFQPFSQADASTARKYGGSGLGLSICKSLIETMMKGKIQLESEENQGTTAWFTVTFDKAPSEVVAGDAQTAPPLPEPTSTPSIKNDPSEFMDYADLARIPKEQLRICIAEDNAINAKIAIQYMQRLGYTKVDSYDNGMKAVEGLRRKALEGTPYHVILMDVQMPVLDGYEATKLLRNDPIEAVRKILVIAMTASAIQGDREKCLAAGMNDYLAKPVRSDVLKKKLETYLGVQRPLERSLSIPRLPSDSAARHTSRPPPVDRNVDATPTQESTDRTLAHPPATPGGGESGGRASVDTAKTSFETNGDATSPTTKRQPRKLTKNRRDSDMSAKEKVKNGVLSPRKEQTQADGVEKQTQQQEVDGPAQTDGAENPPLPS
ncbi:hsp90-like protein [Coniochaeta sp. 2T2.1]|nr:hsp90-like protein [Coniochaeta sp. 2T2.1]